MNGRTLHIAAKEFALKAHGDQLYGGNPYSFHLEAAVKVARDFELSDAVIAGCWLHDTMEDCDVSFNEVSETFGRTIADIVFAVTDEPGKDRADRKHKTYPKILKIEEALQVKLCDRIANVSYSVELNSVKHIDKYRQEHVEFRNVLYSPDHSKPTLALWDHLEGLFASVAQ
jgi:(p)ppGpp synthase/HD superfamily hydrolase